LAIIRKTEPLIALLFGTLLARNFCNIFNPTSSIKLLSGANDFQSAYKGVMDAITGKVVIPTDNETLLFFTSGGMQKMLGTIWLIICAMVLVV
jgi:NhaC family Na+:H+ antiporter